MPAALSDGSLTPSHLQCEGGGASPVVFTDTLAGDVRVKIGDSIGLIRREEIAALAQLFPVRRQCPAATSVI